MGRVTSGDDDFINFSKLKMPFLTGKFCKWSSPIVTHSEKCRKIKAFRTCCHPPQKGGEEGQAIRTEKERSCINEWSTSILGCGQNMAHP